VIDELRRAGVIGIGLPMYNFGVPSPLKAYFDHIARAGETPPHGQGTWVC
jgi:FMN-dependent NADH-azoreductase